MTVDIALFLLFGGLAVLAAVAMLLSENAVHSALFLIVNFGCVAFMYLLLDASFLTMVQIAVYAGAIMVLFLFVIMLLGAEKTTDTTRRFRWLGAVAMGLALALLLIVGAPLAAANFALPQAPAPDPLLRIVNAVPDTRINFDNDVPGDVVSLADNRVEPLFFNVYLNGEPLTTNFSWGWEDVLDYAEYPAGEHTLTFTVAVNDQELPAVVNGGTAFTFRLEPGDVKTVILSGPAVTNLNAQEVAGDVAPTPSRSGRLEVVNLYSEAPLTLVDIGPDRVLNTRTRDGVTVITDRVVAEGVGAEGQIVTYDEGVYDMLFITADLETVAEFRGLQVTRDASQLLLLAPQTQFDGAQRPVLVARPALQVDTHAAFGGPHAVGQALFTTFVLPVQIVGALLLVALVGVVVLTRAEPARQRRRLPGRVKVSRPLVNVISAQTGEPIGTERPPQLDAGD